MIADVSLPQSAIQMRDIPPPFFLGGLQAYLFFCSERREALANEGGGRFFFLPLSRMKGARVSRCVAVCDSSDFDLCVSVCVLRHWPSRLTY
jgi:hypothetical protein